MAETNLFKWRHYQSEIILLCVRWYLRYALSHRDLEEMMNERGLSLDHTTIYRWVQAYALELEKRIRPHLRLANDSYRVDETYVKIKGKWSYLYRAVDSTGKRSTSCLALEGTQEPPNDSSARCSRPHRTHLREWSTSIRIQPIRRRSSN